MAVFGREIATARDPASATAVAFGVAHALEPRTSVGWLGDDSRYDVAAARGGDPFALPAATNGELAARGVSSPAAVLGTTRIVLAFG